MHSAVKRDAVGEARMIHIVTADFEQICEQLRTGRLHGALAEQGLRAAVQASARVAARAVCTATAWLSVARAGAATGLCYLPPLRHRAR